MLRDDDDANNKRRRIRIDDDDEDEIGSNPDELMNAQLEAESEEEGEDLGETWKDDYAAAPELDTYEAEHLDDRVFEQDYLADLRNRQQADEEIEAREEAARLARQKDDFAREGAEGIDDQEREEAEEDSDDDYLTDEDDEDVPEGERERRLNLDAFDCPLHEWISESRTRREIESRFRRFLSTYYDGCEQVNTWRRENEGKEGFDLRDCPFPRLHPIYKEKIRAMCGANSASLEVNYGHLGEAQSLLAIWLTDMPNAMLEIFDGVLVKVVEREFPHYKRIHKELHVRMAGLPICDKLRELRQTDLNSLIRVSGVVTRRSAVSPQIKGYAYDCPSCRQLHGPYASESDRPRYCLNPGCESQLLKLNSHKSEYRNYQRLTLQETPGSVPPGRVPRYKEVELLGDLIDSARPGEDIDVIGVYAHTENPAAMQTMKGAGGFPVYSTNIKANNILKKSSSANAGLSEGDRRRIKELSSDPAIAERIIRSIAPSIYGHKDVKEAIALSLFGGCAKLGGGGTHRVRGDINLLLLGDPGTAKSQFLKYSEKTAPRSVFSTGKGASAVGLTAGVHKDPLTGAWALEGGALVLADQGVCLIDEFDKMNEQDRTSIHEAMEQQSISISKAGIVASLQARCAVIAAANPIGGRYDPSYTLSENVELTDPILQRFDILCVLQDTVDPVVDEQLATFVVNSHMHSHPEYAGDDEGHTDEDSLDNGSGSGNGSIPGTGGAGTGAGGGTGGGGGGYGGADLLRQNMMQDDGDEGPSPLDQDTLKKYITFARASCKPILHNVDLEKIASLYADLRKQSASSGGVPIAVRHIESVMRMAEASAKMHLRDHVRNDDVDRAIRVMLGSFLQAQKVAVQRQLERSFRKYVNFGADTGLLLMHQLKQLVREKEHMARAKNQPANKETVITRSEFEKNARELGVYNCEPFYNSSVFKNLNFSATQWQIVKTYV